MMYTILDADQRILSASFSEMNLNNNSLLYYDTQDDLIILNSDKDAEYVKDTWNMLEDLLSMEDEDFEEVASMVSGKAAALMCALRARREAAKCENEEEK